MPTASSSTPRTTSQTERLEKYGTLDLRLHRARDRGAAGGTRGWCASQYYPANPTDFSTWDLTDEQYDAGRRRTPDLTRDAATQTHFVIDTSRNGRARGTPAGRPYPTPRTGATRPDRGARARPTTDTGDAAGRRVPVDQGPGRVRRQVLPRHGRPARPGRGIEDPAAGQWFPEQARELVEFAVPSFG